MPLRVKYDGNTLFWEKTSLQGAEHADFSTKKNA